MNARYGPEIDSEDMIEIGKQTFAVNSLLMKESEFSKMDFEDAGLYPRGDDTAYRFWSSMLTKER